jgi:hypothetical protein
MVMVMNNYVEFLPLPKSASKFKRDVFYPPLQATFFSNGKCDGKSNGPGHASLKM